MSHRFLTTIVGLCLVSSVASAEGGAPDWGDLAALSKAASATPPKASPAAPTSAKASTPAAPPKAAPAAPAKAVEPKRDAKTTEYDYEDEMPSQRFAGVDTAKPKEDQSVKKRQEVEVEGIEGTMARYDVRQTLESRDEDFDRCHDVAGGSGGKLVFKIHILANGDVGGVKVSKIGVRNKKLADCYTEVVASSKFQRPHGGYADVKWTSKVGRSRKKPGAIFERKVRWDAPASAGGTRRAEAEGKQRRSKNPGGA